MVATMLQYKWVTSTWPAPWTHTRLSVNSISMKEVGRKQSAFPQAPTPTQSQCPLPQQHPRWRVHVLQLTNLHGDILTTQSHRLRDSHFCCCVFRGSGKTSKWREISLSSYLLRVFPFFNWSIVDVQYYISYKWITWWFTLFKRYPPFIVTIKYWLYLLCCTVGPCSLFC